MDATRKTAMAVGILFIVATAASVIGGVALANPVLDSKDYLVELAGSKDQVAAGVLLQVIAAFASVGIAVGLYPVLRKHSEGLALGSVVFRCIEAVGYIVATISVASLWTLSREYVDAGAPDASHYQVLGTVLVAAHDWAGSVLGVMAFGTGALMYYYVFYKSRLIPRWLSIWGLGAIILLLASVLLIMFDRIGALSTTQVALAFPIGVQEIALAVWLIVKGFAPSRQSPMGPEFAQSVSASRS